MNSAAIPSAFNISRGLNDLLAASDLIEGLLNNEDRPPVKNAAGRLILSGEPLPHFNEVDKCTGLDGLMTFRVHCALGQPVGNTFARFALGDYDRSGTTADYKGTDSHRHRPMYFRLGSELLAGGGALRHVVESSIHDDFADPARRSGRSRSRTRMKTVRSTGANGASSIRIVSSEPMLEVQTM
ncbi:MAG TPA: hypothetical protein VL069_07450 [Opitutus sp.]|nr:hypothetical protein [Opitutus sp.]